MSRSSTASIDVWRWLRAHSLSLALGAILLSMLVATLVMGPAQYQAEGVQGSFWRWWAYETILSLEADVFGAILLVVFTKHLYERHSAEAKDPPEQS